MQKTTPNLLLVALLLFSIAWAVRYEYIPMQETRGFYYRINRWTGDIVLLVPDGLRELEQRR